MVYTLCAFHSLLLRNVNHPTIRNEYIKQTKYLFFFFLTCREKSHTDLSFSFLDFHKFKEADFIAVLVELLNGLLQNF